MCAGQYRGAERLDSMILYVMAYYRQQREALAYRNYIADSLYCLQHNMAVQNRYKDLIAGKVKEESGEEIIDRIKKKLGGEPNECV